MILERFIRHLKEGDLHAAAENLGNELPRNRIGLLRRTRSELAKLQSSTESAYVRGYMAAMADMVAAYETATKTSEE